MPKYYPGWILRLDVYYESTDVTLRKLCNLACNYKYSNLDICHVKQLPGSIPFKDASKVFAMNWRFFPTYVNKNFTLGSRDFRFSSLALFFVLMCLNFFHEFP